MSDHDTPDTPPNAWVLAVASNFISCAEHLFEWPAPGVSLEKGEGGISLYYFEGEKKTALVRIGNKGDIFIYGGGTGLPVKTLYANENPSGYQVIKLHQLIEEYRK